MSRVGRWPLVRALLFVIPALASSQVNTATIYGTVTDPSGAAVAQATVIVSNQQTGGAWNAASNARASTRSRSCRPALTPSPLARPGERLPANGRVARGLLEDLPHLHKQPQTPKRRWLSGALHRRESSSAHRRVVGACSRDQEEELPCATTITIRRTTT